MVTRRRTLLALAAGALALPVAVTTGVTTSPASATSPAAGWSGAWAGVTDTSAPATTLAQVRTIIGADAGAAAALTGKGVGVALIDTGVAPVPGLPAAQIVNGPDLSFESQAPGLRYLDTYGHGTHMAGIIVGDDAESGAKGLAPQAKLTSIKIGTARGAVDVTQMIAAVDWVVKHRNDDPANPIRVINLSYGSGGNPPNWTDPLQFAVEKAWQAGIVVVAAAGNNGNTTLKLTNPAMDEWVLAVGATATNGTAATKDDTLATFTNLAVGGNQVDLLAPGTSIASLRDPGSNIDNSYPSARVGSTLFKGSGTSQATAVVSAAAALLLQAKPSATPDQVKDWLIKGGTYLPTGKAGTMGLLELNVNGALARTGTAVTKPTWNTSSGIGLFEVSRGTSHVVLDGTSLAGERSVWGPLTSLQWASKSAAQTSWSGGTWMGFKIAGDAWTGTSWASKTWAPATWSSSPWVSGATWTDPAWTGRTWSGRTWSAGTWSGRTWSSDDWSATSWS
ncbi:S8 family serine peptidase [Dactylosporangium sp. NPDC005555]|uniref:S8 family serine peptidase n=1 Tax=Dactylosporangium sp. NPDC005555 TaxID=3154889 RepID=UPI00339EA58C